MLEAKNTVLVIIDVQQRLANAMQNKEQLAKNAEKLVKGANVLEIPTILMEQNPKGLGPTIPEISNALPDVTPIEKMSFSCCEADGFKEKIESLGRKQVLIAGIEMHVCVYQTAANLIEMGYEVEVVADVTSSRTKENLEIGLQKVRDCGASLTCVETALFELLKAAGGDLFKQILKIIK